jgi:hypothetical protein
MDTAVSFIKVGVRLAGNLCGVPGVSVLADAVVALIETCENIPKRRQVPSTHVLLTRQLTTYIQAERKELAGAMLVSA